MAVKIITNNQPRNVLDWNELTEKEKEEYRGELNPDEVTFARYKGQIYWLDGEFMVMTDMTHYPNWHGVYQDTYFSGILMKFVDDDHVIMGRYYETG
jgi:hypothetical protein